MYRCISLTIALLQFFPSQSSTPSYDDDVFGPLQADRISDERLRNIYVQTRDRFGVIAREEAYTRRIIPRGKVWDELSDEEKAVINRAKEKRINDRRTFILEPKASDDADYIIQAIGIALDSNPPDWISIRAALASTEAGMRYDNRIVPHIRKILEYPRGQKIDGQHAQALRDALRALAWCSTEESLGLLQECVEPDFWLSFPIRTPIISTDPTESVLKMRKAALYAISEADADVCLPVLEKLAQRYPERRYGPWRYPYMFEESAGGAIAFAIWYVKRQEGIPIEFDPFNEWLQQMGLPPVNLDETN